MQSTLGRSAAAILLLLTLAPTTIATSVHAEPKPISIDVTDVYVDAGIHQCYGVAPATTSCSVGPFRLPDNDDPIEWETVVGPGFYGHYTMRLDGPSGSVVETCDIYPPLSGIQSSCLLDLTNAYFYGGELVTLQIHVQSIGGYYSNVFGSGPVGPWGGRVTV